MAENQSNTIEKWHDVPGYEGFYQVSDLGRVRRVKLSRGAVVGIMRSAPNFYGYPRVSLCRNNRPRQYLVHRLVAAAFLGQCPEGCEVNHKDGNKANAVLLNLEYVTSKGNSQHAIKMGLIARGARSGTSKLTDKSVIEIRELFYTGMCNTDIAKKYNVSRRTIADIRSGMTWKHIQ